MSTPAELDDQSLARAVEQNAADLLLRMGAAGGGHARDGDVVWSLGGSPVDYHNAVVGADLEADAADSAIAESRELLARAALPGTWHVGPSMRPLDLPARLEAAGFAADGDEPGMAASLDRMVEHRVPGIDIETVSDARALSEWVEALGSGFGEGPREAEWVGEVFDRMGLGHPDLRLVLARRNDRVVGTATVFFSSGVAGLYFVSTVPEARRQGVGAFLTRGAMAAARDAGARHVVLTSSAAGRPLYESLGFRQVCTIRLYTWRPS